MLQHYLNYKIQYMLFLRVEARDAQGRSPLLLAILAQSKGIALLLLDKGADVEAQDGKRERTALHFAAWQGYEPLVRLLLERGANIEARDEYQRWETALHKAVERGHETVIRLLVEKGADVSARDDNGRTARDIAVASGRKDLEQLLVGKAGDKSEGR